MQKCNLFKDKLHKLKYENIAVRGDDWGILIAMASRTRSGVSARKSRPNRTEKRTGAVPARSPAKASVQDHISMSIVEEIISENSQAIWDAQRTRSIILEAVSEVL